MSSLMRLIGLHVFFLFLSFMDLSLLSFLSCIVSVGSQGCNLYVKPLTPSSKCVPMTREGVGEHSLCVISFSLKARLFFHFDFFIVSLWLAMLFLSLSIFICSDCLFVYGHHVIIISLIFTVLFWLMFDESSFVSFLDLFMCVEMRWEVAFEHEFGHLLENQGNFFMLDRHVEHKYFPVLTTLLRQTLLCCQLWLILNC
jgi:hypothetical protein